MKPHSYSLRHHSVLFLLLLTLSISHLALAVIVPHWLNNESLSRQSGAAGWPKPVPPPPPPPDLPGHYVPFSEIEECPLLRTRDAPTRAKDVYVIPALDAENEFAGLLMMV